MNILVIGSKGFIGSYCISILAARYCVWGCDIVNDYIAANYIQIDATNADFRQVFEKQLFDVCINCSGAAVVSYSFQNPVKDYTLNTFNVIKILEAIRINQPACKLINLSSAAVYGNPIALPISENAALMPLSPYGLHKKQSEEIIREYVQFFNLSACSLRLFSVYGPGLKKQIFWDLHSKLSSTNKIELWGTGYETRDFIYIDDLIQAIDCVMNKATFKGEVINVANGIEISIDHAVDIFHELYFRPFEFEFDGQHREGDPINWKADISILHGMGYKSKVTIEQGLTAYIKWLKEELR